MTHHTALRPRLHDRSAGRPTAAAAMAPLISLLVLTLPAMPFPANAQSLLPNVWVPDNTVYATAVSGNVLYMCGAFRHLGPYTGGAAAIGDASAAALDGSPVVRGTVRVIVPDGAGGWYLGGDFDQVGGLPRQNLARLNPDLSVADWNPGANLSVYAIAASGSLVYVGGNFTQIGGMARNRIAALDAATGAPTVWNPDANAAVRALVPSGTVVYAGGSFSGIGGATRHGIAAIRMNNGNATTWSADVNAGQTVRTIVVGGNTVYLGGSFGSVGGQARGGMAAVDATTGLVTTWNPGAGWEVRAMVLSGATMFVGGTFDAVGGQPRVRLAEIDLVTGLATAWNPGVGPNAPITTVDALTLSGSTLYVGGYFDTTAGALRRKVAAVDVSTGQATAWNPITGPESATVLALAASGSTVFAGGSFVSIGQVARDYVAAIDLETGRPTDWNPQPDALVRCLAMSGSNVHIGGDFLTVGGQPHARLASIDAVTGVPAAWNAGANNLVTTLAADGNTLYAAGNFSSIGGQSRSLLAAVDATTGLATAWNPAIGGPISALAVDAGIVYVGGSFNSAGGVTRHGLAAFDAVTGAVRPWNPDVEFIGAPVPASLNAIEPGPSSIFIGGHFNRVGGVERLSLAEVDRVGGLATAWNPGVNWEVFALDLAGSTLYVGGGFSQVGGLPRNMVAAVDAHSGLPTPWNPDAQGGTVCCGLSVRAISTSDAGVCLAGSFGQVLGVPTLHLGVVTDPFVVSVPPGPAEPPGLALAPPAPHPMTDEATLRFTLPRAGAVTLDLHDAAGRLVRRLLRHRMEAGLHALRLERDGLGAGLYFVRLSAPSGTASGKLVVGP